MTKTGTYRNRDGHLFSNEEFLKYCRTNGLVRGSAPVRAPHNITITLDLIQMYYTGTIYRKIGEIK